MTGLVPLRQQSNRAALREIKHAKRDERRIARKAIRGVKKMESSNRHQVEMNAHKKRKRELLEQAKLEAEGKDPSTASSSPKKNQLVAADGVVKSKKRKSCVFFSSCCFIIRPADLICSYTIERT